MTAVREVGRFLLFGWDVVRSAATRGIRLRDVVEQMHAVGWRSLSTTIVTGLFVGAIMAIQINLQLRDFGAQAFLGGLTASVTLRNVGPVLIAFILSGKVGAYTSGELATMRVTDQIDAIRCLGTDPLSLLIAPRMAAAVLSSFLLLVVGLMVSLGGAAAIAHFQLGVNTVTFSRSLPEIVQWSSVGMSVVKSFVFGTLIGWIACYRGYTATGGAVGVGEAVKGTSVTTLVAIIVTDSTLSWLFSRLRLFLE